MVYFVELNKDNEAHSSLNYSMIKVLALKYEDITVFSSKRHFKAIGLDEHDLKRVLFKSIRVIDGNWTCWFTKVLRESFNVYTIFRAAKRESVQLIYISSIFPISHPFFKVIKKLFPGIRVIVGLHGEMEFLKDTKSRKLRFLGWFLKGGFKIVDQSVKYLVFGAIIKENLSGYSVPSQSSLLSIDHPYDYRTVSIGTEKRSNNLQLGTIGIGSINKRTQNLFLLADYFKAEVLSNRLSFNLIGTMLPDLEKFVNSYVQTNGFNTILSKKEFERKIFDLHYSLFFYDNEFYSLCASGAFFDAIKFEKPILALKNDYFTYYFNRLGNIGYLFDDLNAMKSKINEILLGNYQTEYQEQVENLQRAKLQLSIEKIADDFFSQFNGSKF